MLDLASLVAANDRRAAKMLAARDGACEDEPLSDHCHEDEEQVSGDCAYCGGGPLVWLGDWGKSMTVYRCRACGGDNMLHARPLGEYEGARSPAAGEEDGSLAPAVVGSNFYGD